MATHFACKLAIGIRVNAHAICMGGSGGGGLRGLQPPLFKTLPAETYNLCEPLSLYIATCYHWECLKSEC